MVIAVDVKVAAQDVEAAVFHKALGFGLAGGQGHLGGAGGYCQGDYAPLHHLH